MKKKRLFIGLSLCLLLPTVTLADEKNPFDIHSDAIYQEEGEDDSSDYNKIQSQLFLDRQNQKNARVQKEENDAVYSTKKQLFLEGQASSDNLFDTTETVSLFQDDFRLEETFSSEENRQTRLTISSFGSFTLIIGALVMVLIGWVLGKNKALKAMLTRRTKHG